MHPPFGDIFSDRLPNWSEELHGSRLYYSPTLSIVSGFNILVVDKGMSPIIVAPHIAKIKTTGSYSSTCEDVEFKFTRGRVRAKN